MKNSGVGSMKLAATLLLLFWVTAQPKPALPGGGAVPEQEEPGHALLAFVSIPPQASFVSAVAGERARVEILVSGGQDPHTYEPSPRRVAALQRADVYFAVGLPFEELLLKKVSGSAGFTVVHTDRGVPKRPLEAHAGVSGGGEPDPHIWLSPPLIEIQAGNIYRALAEADPVNEAEYRENLEAYLDELHRVHARLEELLAPYRGEPFFVFHPAFGYFADAYGLRQLPIEIGGREPGPRGLAELIGRGQAAGARVVFVQQQFSQRSARAVAEAIGAEVVEADPLALDYIDNLRAVSKRMLAALAPEAGAS